LSRTAFSFANLLRSGAAGCLLLAAACSSPPPRDNVLLITLDTQRSDFISAYGPGPAATPHIDRLVERGVLFTNAFSPIPITLPAHAALFYSQPPHRLGVYNNGQVFHPAEGASSLAEVFERRGYTTAAFVSLGVLHSRFGLNRGFAHYRDTPHNTRWYLDAGEINQRVGEWLDDDPMEPFFLWIHYSDPHDPYAPPGLPPDLRIYLNGERNRDLVARRRERLEMAFPLRPGKNIIRFESLRPFPVPRDDYRFSLNDIIFRHPEGIRLTFRDLALLSRGDAQILAIKDTGEIHIHNPEDAASLEITAQVNINLFPSESIDGYRAETEYLDSRIGRLTDRFVRDGRMEHTIILLAGDHGEGLGEYIDPRGEAHFGHVHYLQDIYVRVPMIYIDPSGPAGLRVDHPVSLIDIAPTLVNRMNWKIPERWSGRDLLEEHDARGDPVFFETYTPEAARETFAMLAPPWHLIFIPEKREFRLYDRRTDPREKQDIFSRMRGLPEIQALTRELARRAASILDHKRDVPLDAKSREMLKSLGYIK